KMKPSCLPYEFLKEIFYKTTGKNKEILSVEDLLRFSPKEINEHLKPKNEELMIRKGLETARRNLMALGLTEKNGKFLSGCYHTTEWSPKEDWIIKWITEFDFSKKDAEKLYNLAKKAELRIN
ncbi:MAG: hypothetical protein RL641_307, partial [Candidatus Parcubacteria bacterium]